MRSDSTLNMFTIKSKSVLHFYYMIFVVTIITTVACIVHLHSKYSRQMHKFEYCGIDYNCTDTHIAKNISIKISPFDEIWQEHSDVIGGSWYPDNCISEAKIALIIPYRDRETHLQMFIQNIIPFLKTQKKAFTIFIVEQTGPQVFNKAQMMNAGFIESQKISNYTCFIFHDVDMIPLNLCNLYVCPANGMRHLGLSKTPERPRLHYGACVGGASAFTKEVFTQINGFTNVMFGWGGEDDDAYFRLRRKKIRIHRHSPLIGNYFALPHIKFGKGNPHSHRGMKAVRHNKYMDFDGLNTVNYKIESVTKEKLFIRIVASVPGPETIADAVIFFKKKTEEYVQLLENHSPTMLHP